LTYYSEIFVAEYLKSRGKRVIPESDIGLAILHCSINRHCNPDYKVASALVVKGTREVNSQPELILALDTQESGSESIKRIKQAGKDIVIPESGTVQKSACLGVTSVPKHMMNCRENVNTKNEAISFPASSMEKQRLSARDDVDASVTPRKRLVETL
jgi:hypothetical protein